MKIFVAIKISEKLQGEILEWEKKYKSLPARWLRPENIHITIIPPWETENIEEAKRMLDSLGKKGGFEVAFHKICYGPNPKHPRLIWVEGEGGKEYEALRTDLENIFGAVKGQKGRGDGFIHLTLARFNPEDFRRFSVKELEEPVNWIEKVKNVVLLQSFPGSVYKELYKVAL
jgi:2'-5' RNA ligase